MLQVLQLIKVFIMIYKEQQINKKKARQHLLDAIYWLIQLPFLYSFLVTNGY